MKNTGKWLTLTVTSFGTLTATLMASGINIANPILAREFDISMGMVQWVTTVYLIVLCAFTLLFGRIGDRVGSHKIYLLGSVVFLVGTLACGFSKVFLLLLAMRAVQALGAAMVVATSMALVSTTFPKEQRGMALGVNVLMVGIGNTCGPALAGIILSKLSWSFIFYLYLPIGIVGFVIAAFKLRSPVPPQGKTAAVDLPGTVLLAGFTSSLIVFLSGSVRFSLFFAPVSALCLALFLYCEKRRPLPLFDFEVMRNRRFSVGNLITFLSYAASMAVTFQLPFFLEGVWGVDVGVAGMLLMVSAIAMGIAGPVSGLVSDRVGALRVMPPSLALIIVGQGTLFFVGTEVTYPLFILCLAMTGFGLGFLNTPNNSDIMSSVGREAASYASGFVGTNRNLAFCIGTAASAGVFSKVFALSEKTKAGAEAHLFSFRVILAIAITLTVTSLIICLRLKALQRGAGK